MFCSQSASCVHVSGLLHALVAMNPGPFHAQRTDELQDDEEETPLPITSYACQWKMPCKRKESTLLMSSATFNKHTYGKQKTRTFQSMEDFDPRPVEFRGTANSNVKELLDKLAGKGLSISLSLDPQSRCWNESSSSAQVISPQLPSKQELQNRVDTFKKNLEFHPDRYREIEQATRDQNQSPLWFSVRRYRLTASYFGAIYHRLPSTPPHSLVMQILGKSCNFTSPAVEWGKQKESVALQKYVEQQQDTHKDLYISKSGFIISEDHPFLGASPDAVVYDPTDNEPFGLAEVKCPYSCRNLLPSEACLRPNFCSIIVHDVNSQPKVQLKRSHSYYSQVQGQLAISKRAWCDFIIYTEKGINIERIRYDQHYW